MVVLVHCGALWLQGFSFVFFFLYIVLLLRLVSPSGIATTSLDALFFVNLKQMLYPPWFVYSSSLCHSTYNLDGSNMDGSFTVDDSNSFLSP